MGVTALCFRLLMLEFTLLNSYTLKSDAAFLRVTPNRQQYFEHDSVSFDCEGSDGSTHLRVIRNNQKSDVECDTKTPTGSCTIKRVYQSEDGEFWCETEGGERSNSVNISVTAGNVILEIPALPVTEGDDVTLSCRNKTTPSSNLPAGFYKGGQPVQSSSSREMTIHNVSKSDEGVYDCRISGVGDSPGSWLAVRGQTEQCYKTTYRRVVDEQIDVTSTLTNVVV
ncbi:low affinity immunoglobulin gamma Fc region receptor II-like [Sebastes fasciatus]|uniref:low affinity immunoglobulin gamma Fc region receptor II-like n=1 Tax=Sebastes fasciatus TaxID=394691 RepID=UPI003D9E38B5